MEGLSVSSFGRVFNVPGGDEGLKGSRLKVVLAHPEPPNVLQFLCRVFEALSDEGH